ncbi:glycosyltransferase [Flavobacteriales bacterium]|nr:glycosyltransferase [Flavobacteriales bacterium]
MIGQVRREAISFVIPTLWRPTTMLTLLHGLHQSVDVLEIIVIDNAPSQRPKLPDWAKIRIVEQSSNSYVNPSWNLGVELAQSNRICLCNDDILFADNLLPFMRQARTKGIVGLHPNSYSTALKDAADPQWSKEVHITRNWGSLLFFDRDRYVPIPETMKIWWGDAWLAQEMKPARSIKTAVSTPHSVSAGSDEFKEITNQDTHLWRESYQKPPLVSKRLGVALRVLLRKLKVS